MTYGQIGFLASGSGTGAGATGGNVNIDTILENGLKRDALHYIDGNWNGSDNLPALTESLPIRGKSQYIRNLNDSKSLLQRNEKMINLTKYNKDAIIAGKDGDEVWKGLNKYVEFRS